MMSEKTSADAPVDDDKTDDEIPHQMKEEIQAENTLNAEGLSSQDTEIQSETVVDPLEEAIARAVQAEKEIAYRDAEIQNVRKRLMAEKAEAIQFGGMGLARRMLSVLADVDRALAGIDEADQSPVTQGLRLLRSKMWHELQADGVSQIESKGVGFDPTKMEAITTIPASEAFPSGIVVEVLEQGYMYKSKVIVIARVVVASQ